MNKSLKISFDFDGCLGDNKFVQIIAKLFRDAGNEIWILTSRDPKSENRDVWKLASDFNIPIDRVIMTNGTLKVHKFLEMKFDIHFDNSWDEVVAINDIFENLDQFKNCDSMPAIFVNFNSEELGFAFNTIMK